MKSSTLIGSLLATAQYAAASTVVSNYLQICPYDFCQVGVIVASLSAPDSYTDCKTFQACTVTPVPVTVTVTGSGSTTTSSQVAPPVKRTTGITLVTAVTSCPTAIPTYATACASSVAFASACDCLGFSATTSTLTASTTTVIIPASTTSSSIATPSSTVTSSSSASSSASTSGSTSSSSSSVTSSSTSSSFVSPTSSSATSSSTSFTASSSPSSTASSSSSSTASSTTSSSISSTTSSTSSSTTSSTASSTTSSTASTTSSTASSTSSTTSSSASSTTSSTASTTSSTASSTSSTTSSSTITSSGSSSSTSSTVSSTVTSTFTTSTSSSTITSATSTSTTTSATSTSSTTTSSSAAATIIVPLYQYPLSGAYDALYQGIALRPDVTFVVIINPNSGPGSSTYPDDNYYTAIQKLNAYSNVQTVGYVKTGYAGTAIATVKSQIDIYAGWSTKSSTIAMKGIYFDEVPYVYSATAATYLETIDARVKSSSGLLGNKLVIHNPGTILDTRYLTLSKVDVTVVAGTDYNSWVATQSANVASMPTGTYGVMLNSVPIMATTALKTFVSSITSTAKYIFITNLSSNPYGSFGSDWLDFCRVMNGGVATTSTSTSTSTSTTVYSGPMATIVIPLYIYPLTNASWAPLYEAIALRTDVQFMVVVNPNSGPGGVSPDSNYTPAIQKLNSFANVQTIGYVRTGYATNNITDVIAQVNMYAGWSSLSSSLAMHGIFFDEAPYEYNATAVAYMKTIDAAVKASTGLKGAKTVIHNPGVVVDLAYLDDSNLDFTFIFEQSYDHWFAGQNAAVQAMPSNRGAYGIMMHSLPTMTTSGLKTLLQTLSPIAQYIFLTNNVVDYYEQWGSDLSDFVTTCNT